MQWQHQRIAHLVNQNKTNRKKKIGRRMGGFPIDAIAPLSLVSKMVVSETPAYIELPMDKAFFL